MGDGLKNWIDQQFANKTLFEVCVQNESEFKAFISNFWNEWDKVTFSKEEILFGMSLSKYQSLPKIHAKFQKFEMCFLCQVQSFVFSMGNVF